MQSTSADSAKSYQVNPADVPGESVIFGRTAGMQKIRERINSALISDTPVLIQGESGTGKELIAKYLHLRSIRGRAPFVKMNCAAIPKKVFESELQCFERQSAAGSTSGKPGMIQMAAGGTLFLDDISALDREQQDRLFHLVYQSRSAQNRVKEEQSSRVRFIYACNFDLEAAAEVRSYSRVNPELTDIVHLRLLALRERKTDIPQLCEFFMQKLSRKFRKSEVQLTTETLALMQQWIWPGNVRELENWIARTIILGSAETLVEELANQVTTAKASRKRNLPLRDSEAAFAQGVSAETRESVLKALQANGWSRRKAAKELHISYRSLLYQLGSSNAPHRRRSHSALHSGPSGTNEQ